MREYLVLGKLEGMLDCHRYNADWTDLPHRNSSLLDATCSLIFGGAQNLGRRECGERVFARERLCQRCL
jgi:hypothetical protein